MRITDEYEAMVELGACLCGGPGPKMKRWEEQTPILKKRIKREWRRQFIREQLNYEEFPDDRIFARMIR